MTIRNVSSDWQVLAEPRTVSDFEDLWFAYRTFVLHEAVRPSVAKTTAELRY